MDFGGFLQLQLPLRAEEKQIALHSCIKRHPPALVVRGNTLPPRGMYLRSAFGDLVRLQEEQSARATDELYIGLERICPVSQTAVKPLALPRRRIGMLSLGTS